LPYIKKTKLMSRIKQAYISPPIKYFKKNFMDRYGLSEYHDLDAPSIFFGAKESGDVINKHRGYKVVLPSTPIDYPKLNNFNKTLFICSDNYELPPEVIRKNITPEIKDYSLFKPGVLGDKIYTYGGFRKGWDLKNKILLNQIQKKINYEIISTSHLTLNDYYDIQYLKTNYYDRCFLNLNFTQGNGLSTSIELGLMGVKTVFKNPHTNNIQRLDFPNFIDYNTIDDIINIILGESKKIGTTQPPINAHNVGDEWLDLDFWL
jgi:hypothetical protein